MIGPLSTETNFCLDFQKYIFPVPIIYFADVMGQKRPNTFLKLFRTLLIFFLKIRAPFTPNWNFGENGNPGLVLNEPCSESHKGSNLPHPHPGYKCKVSWVRCRMTSGGIRTLRSEWRNAIVYNSESFQWRELPRTWLAPLAKHSLLLFSIDSLLWQAMPPSGVGEVGSGHDYSLLDFLAVRVFCRFGKHMYVHTPYMSGDDILIPRIQKGLGLERLPHASEMSHSAHLTISVSKPMFVVRKLFQYHPSWKLLRIFCLIHHLSKR